MSPQPISSRRMKALARGEGDARWWFGGLAVVRIDGRQSEGKFSLIEMLYPGGAQVPLHVHTREDELFQVLEGRIAYQIGEQRIEAGPGHTIFAPRDVPHGFEVVSEEPARYLIVYAPSGFEGYIRETSQPAGSLTLPPPMPHPDAKIQARLAEMMSDRYGCHYV